jgi:iron complex outermembrane receptor protein
VLLNGRRLANFAFLSGTVNLGAIPMAAIERVEILKDGASSVYGSDAVAGVVNFITRKDYAGFDVVGQAGITERGGGDNYQATVSAGWGNLARDRVNAFVTFDWQRQTALAAIDRPYTAARPDEGVYHVSLNTFPANIRVNSTHYVNPGFASGCQPPASIPLTDVQGTQGDVCAFDYTATANLLPDTERWTVLGRGIWQIAPEHQAFVEYLFARTRMTSAFSPTPVDRNLAGDPVYYPVDGPYYPTAFAAANGLSGPLRVRYRTLSLGSRTDEVTTDAQRLVVGADGSIGPWNYGIGYNYSQNTGTDDFVRGWVLSSRIIPAIATGLVNLWGPSGQAGNDLVASSEYTGVVRNAKGTLNQVDFQASREWIELPGGPLGVAFGGEWRRESLVDRPAPILDTGDVISFNAEISPQSASRNVGALFAEINVPVTKQLEVLAAVRYDHYSDFGGTTNPKVGVRWQPVNTLLLRGAWGTGFRAPTLPDLYTPQFTSGGNTGLTDPVRCPVTGSPDDCGLGEYDVVSGGNPALKPETSTQETAGVIWEPAKGWSLGAQWWRIDKNDAISVVGAQDILDLYGTFGATNVIRGPVDPAYPNLPGPIETIVANNQNLGSLKTSGIDFSLRAQSPTSAWGQLSLSFDGTYVYQFVEELPGLPPYSDVGQLSFYGPIPRWRHYAQLNWQYGPWGATLAQSFQSGVTDGQLNPAGFARNVGTYTLWNLQGVYSGLVNTTITVGIRNLFNTDPPFSNSANFGYLTQYGDPHGRTFYGKLAYSFR